VETLGHGSVADAFVFWLVQVKQHKLRIDAKNAAAVVANRERKEKLKAERDARDAANLEKAIADAAAK
jgi:hypothetical protein